jgi:hypothetical protein
MTMPTTSWVIDCGHWHCPDRLELRHAHTIAPEACPECAEERPVSDRAQKLSERALGIAASKHPKEQP